MSTLASSSRQCGHFERGGDKMNNYMEEMQSIYRLVQFLEEFEASYKEYIGKLQVMIAECMIGDNDAIWDYIQNHMCERMESQVVVAEDVLEEISYEKEFFENMLKESAAGNTAVFQG